MACTPLLAALREGGHEVSALLTTRNAQIFARTALQHVHVVERIPWPKHGYTAPTWERALREASTAGYDIALIASEEPQAYTFAKLAGIPQRVGFYNGWQKPFKSFWARRQLTRAIYRSASLPLHPEQEPYTMFGLGTGLHSETEPTREVERLRPLVVDDDSPKREGTLAQLTAKWIGGDRTAADVAQWLRALYDWRPTTVVAAEDERAAVQEIVDCAEFPVTYFADQRAWKDAIAHAELLVTPDTGAAHVAGMVGTPVVDLFEPKNFVRNAARWAPWAAPMRVTSYSEGYYKDTMATRIIRAAEMLVPTWSHE